MFLSFSHLTTTGLILTMLTLAGCTQGSSVVRNTAPATLNTMPAYEHSLDDILLENDDVFLEKIARELDVDFTGTDAVGNLSEQLDTIHWDDIDASLREIEEQLK
ncbi:MAG: hypothetical protein HY817_03185 [Candidatus Abawacabacteria bacterium]|nr:hypothetical protein [Candidatus Abawacabacteria bacterium]